MRTFITIACLFVSSAFIYGQTSLDYSVESNWYHNGKSIDTTKVDVFYLLPTCVFAWQDVDVVTHYNADVTSENHLKAFSLSCLMGDDIFGKDTNFFLPYYRQSTFGIPVDAQKSDSIKSIAITDVKGAFDYYINNVNKDRPFVLAGFSQGGKMVVELLKYMDDKTYDRLVAAYVVGGGVSASEMHQSNHIVSAQDASSLGVTICFNSVSDIEGISPILWNDNVLCVNPLSWKTNTIPAVLLHKGDVIRDDDKRFPYGTAVRSRMTHIDEKGNLIADNDVTVRVHETKPLLIIDGLDVDHYYFSNLKDLFPKGNLHLQELFFFHDALQANVKQRIQNVRK